MIQLIEALEAKLQENIHKNCKVQHPTELRFSWEITLPDETVKCDGGGNTTKDLAKLLEDLCPKASKTMSQIESSSVKLLYSASTNHKSANRLIALVLVPLNENRKILACSFEVQNLLIGHPKIMF